MNNSGPAQATLDQNWILPSRLRLVVIFFYLFLISSGEASSQSATNYPWPTIEEVNSAQDAGTIGGEFTVTEAGSAAYNIPIAVPPGTAEMVPNLSISYNSSRGNGLLGIGFALEGTSSISHCPMTLAQDNMIDEVDYDSNDRFCLDGQRLVAVVGNYGSNGTEYRTENESYTKVVSFGTKGNSPAYFLAYLKDGSVKEYGSSADSILFPRAPWGAGSSVLSWHLSRIRDRSGNYVAFIYEYETSSTEIRLSRVDYTGNEDTGLQPYNSIRFSYEDRKDILTGWGSKAYLTASRKLKSVQAFTENSLAWQYNLSYSYDSQLNASKLIRVEECDPKGTCLPPTSFSWNPNTAPGFWANNYFEDLSPKQGYVDSNTAPSIIGDWNGDGKSDIARVNHGGIQFYVSIGNGFAPLLFYKNLSPKYGYLTAQENPIFTGDWNADGKTDIGRVHSTGVKLFTSTGKNFVSYASIPNLSGNYGYNSDSNYPIVTGDWDGDGRTDLARFSLSSLVAYRSTGTGFVPYPGFFDLAKNHGYSDSSVAPLVSGDFNGDGLTDIARAGPSGVVAYVSSGAGFALFTSLHDLGISQGYFDAWTAPLISGDFNGDGLSDLARVHSTGINIFVSTGSAFVYLQKYQDLSPNYGYPNGEATPLIAGDWNGDGLTDLARAHQTGIVSIVASSQGFKPYNFLTDFASNYGYRSNSTNPLISADWNGDGVSDISRFSYSSVISYPQIANQSHLLNALTDGLGSTTKITYGLLTNPDIYEKGSGSVYPVLDLQSAGHVVSTVERNNGIGGLNKSSYRYYELRNEVTGRGSSGFGRIKIVDEQTGIIETKYYRQDHPYKGLPFKRELHLANGSILESSEDIWSLKSFGGSRYFVYVSDNTESKFDLDGTLISKVSSNKSYDEFGNLVASRLMHLDGYSEVTLSSYLNDSTNWLIGQLARVEVSKKLGDQPSVKRISSFSYDSRKGLLSKETIEPEENLIRNDISYEYDLFGNIVRKAVSTPNFPSRVSQYSFDPYGRFPLREMNPLGHTEIREYDNRHGKVISLTGPNGLTATWHYDSFGRVYSQTDPYGINTVSALKKVNTQSRASYYNYTKSDGGVPVIKFMDELGREIRSETYGFDGQKIIIDKEYNKFGNLFRVSDPFYEGDLAYWTVNEYDILGRPIKVTQPGNRVTTVSYKGLTATTIDPLKQKTIKVSDLRGNLIESTDNLNGVTRYYYDSLLNLNKVVDPQGNQTTAQYDKAGRKTKVVDPNAGTTTFAYNGYGDLLTQTDNKNQVVRYTYDSLSRVLSKVTPEGSFNWSYDKSLFGIGKISSVTGPANYRESYFYDSSGRPTKIIKKILGESYESRLEYDELNRPELEIYPDGFTIKNKYNSQGFLAEIRDNGSNALYWRAETFNARGALERQTLGNNFLTLKVYAPDTGLLQRIATAGVQDLRLSYNRLGNLTKRYDYIKRLTESFNYDGLNRLISSQVSGQTAITLSYDSIGNIQYKSDIGSYTYAENGAGPSAVTSTNGVSNNSYRYDKNGNRIGSNVGTLVYNSANKPLSIVDEVSRVDFTYGPENQRLTQTQYENDILINQKIYINSNFEKEIIGQIKKSIHYIKAGTDLVAIHTVESGKSEKVVYPLKDHLGSITELTDEQGKIIESLSYDAWGKRRSPTTWASINRIINSSADYGFTGHEQLESVELIHMGGRVYDPKIGRFLTPDPFVQAAEDSQSLNRYSYVLNNPLSLTDPSGYFSIKKLLKIVIPVVTAIIAPQITPFIGTGFAASFVSGSIVGIGSSIATTLVSGGSFSQGIKTGIRSAPFAGFRSAVAFEIGHGEIFGILKQNQIGNLALTKAIAHGAAGGLISSAQGGDFKSAFLSSFGASFVEGLPTPKSIDLLPSILAGGTASAISGGKFREGAMQAALIYAFNSQGGRNPETEPYPDWESERLAAQQDMIDAERMMYYTRIASALERQAEMFFNLYNWPEYTDHPLFSKYDKLFKEGINLSRGFDREGRPLSFRPKLGANTGPFIKPAGKIGPGELANLAGMLNLAMAKYFDHQADIIYRHICSRLPNNCQ